MSTRRALVFPTAEAARRHIFATHLDDYGGFAHERRSGEWIIVYLHPPTQEMARVNDDGTATILYWKNGECSYGDHRIQNHEPRRTK